MQLQILLIILTSLFIQAFAIDLIEEGRKVIIQRDVEHILVKLNLKNTLDTLNSIGKSIFMAKRTLASNTLDSESDSNLKPFFKQLDYLAQQTEIRINAINGVFVINQQENKISRKRGLEILGDILSWGTGVPSARDHRQVLENLKLLRLDNNEMKSMLASSTNTNKAILRSLHMHESRISRNSKIIDLINRKINLQTSYSANLLEILNFKSHIELKLTETDNLVDKINNILQEGRLDKVSELAIDKNSLSKIIEGIILKHRILRPVFEGAEVARYFQLNSALFFIFFLKGWRPKTPFSVFEPILYRYICTYNSGFYIRNTLYCDCLLYTSPSPRDS